MRVFLRADMDRIIISSLKYAIWFEASSAPYGDRHFVPSL